MKRLTPKLRRRILDAARDLVQRQYTLCSFADLMSQPPAIIAEFCAQIAAAVDEGKPEGECLAFVQILHVLHCDAEDELRLGDEGPVWGRDVDEDPATRRAQVSVVWESWRAVGVGVGVGEMSVDGLLVRPPQAAAFCRAVRDISGVAYADDDILNDLLALRKRGELSRATSRATPRSRRSA